MTTKSSSEKFQVSLNLNSNRELDHLVQPCLQLDYKALHMLDSAYWRSSDDEQTKDFFKYMTSSARSSKRLLPRFLKPLSFRSTTRDGTRKQKIFTLSRTQTQKWRSIFKIIWTVEHEDWRVPQWIRGRLRKAKR